MLRVFLRTVLLLTFLSVLYWQERKEKKAAQESRLPHFRDRRNFASALQVQLLTGVVLVLAVPAFTIPLLLSAPAPL